MKQHEIIYRFFRLKGHRGLRFCVAVQTDARLNVQGLYWIAVASAGRLPSDWFHRTRHYLPASDFDGISFDGLGMPYVPAAEPPVRSLETVTPDSMGYEVHAALRRLKNEVGTINAYVRRYMGYTSDSELAAALSAEQVDAVALSVYNIEQRGQGMITGDQTGIGKGRIAASLIRIYARMGKCPVFITEKPNLFSDLYRDLTAIGSAGLVPFIVNGREGKTQVKDEEGNAVYEPPEKQVQERIFASGKPPEGYDFVMATYSQFASERPTVKQSFLASIAQDSVLILDESHNAGGNINVSSTARLFYGVVRQARGALFLSATFAKRPENMPLYAVKTCMSEASMTSEALVEAIETGGVALQEVLSASLVAEGQMIRRERSFEGIEVNYITLNAEGARLFGVENLEKQHCAIADRITEILRDIVSFESRYISKRVEELDEEVKAEMKEVEKRKGTSELGVSSTPYFSKLFMVIHQMLFSIKAEAVAQRAIARLREGKKPVIAFSSTMGAFLDGMENERGLPVSDGDMINADFSAVLLKGLESLFEITEIGASGIRAKRRIALSSLPVEAQAEYSALVKKIGRTSSGISISPVDNIRHTVESAGYTVAEVTGRRLEVQFGKPGAMTGLVRTRKRENVSDAFRRFNNNEVDVLLINQSGSTGASAHAAVSSRVPLEEVRPRVMIVLQPELDINREVQKRGRVNRTGQVYLPAYDYISSAIPAEQRLTMMLQRKLKSLDANTSSNQKQSEAIMQSADFLNKYGDRVVAGWLAEHPDMDKMLGHPAGEDEEKKSEEGLALKVSGRVAILSAKEQKAFYDDVFDGYLSLVNYVKQSGEYDLEVEEMDLQAEPLEKETFIFGKGGRSDFGGDTYLEKIEANVLKKPYTQKEVEQLLKEALAGKTPEALKTKLAADVKNFLLKRAEREEAEIRRYIEEKKRNIHKEPGYGKALDRERYTQERRKEYDGSMEERIRNMRLRLNNEYRYLGSFFDEVKTGDALNCPVLTPDGTAYVPALFLGFKINEKRSNPYAPSAIVARIAVADSRRYIEMTLSGEQGQKLQAILFQSQHGTVSHLLEHWSEHTRNANVRRSVRYAFTGNILQAFGKAAGGKLVSYTCKDGSVKKGILMPEHWRPTERGASVTRSVPLKFCRRAIAGLSRGAMIKTDAGLSFLSRGDGAVYFVTQSLSLQKFNWLVKNPQLLPLIREQGGFQKSGSVWTGSVEVKDLQQAIDAVYEESGCNALLTAAQVDMIRQDIVREEAKPKAPVKLPPLPKETPLPKNAPSAPPPPPAKTAGGRLRLLKLKAKSLKLRLALGDTVRQAAAAGMDGVSEGDVTRRFNRELQMQIDGTLPINHTYSLGRPSGILLAAGLPDLPIELRASLLKTKSSVRYVKAHPFRLEALKNLPCFLQNPVMVFDSQTMAGSKVVLIDLKSGNVNFVAAIRLKYSPGSDKTVRAKVNSIRSIYPKDKVNDIFKWICSGLLRYAEKKKASLFFKELHSQGAQTSFKKSNAFRLKNFNRAANIIQKFVNPKKDKKKVVSHKS
jgi:hypothetical protein